jgi:hypothetical protein
MIRQTIEDEGRRIAEELGVTYTGPQYHHEEFYCHLFTDPLTGSTFAATSRATAWQRFFELREAFGEVPPDYVPSDIKELTLKLRGNIVREMRERGFPEGNPIDHCREARDALAKYEADVKAGHTEAAQYWKGQAEVHALQCAAEGGEVDMTRPRTESERKTWHEKIFGAGSEPPGERKGLGQTTNSLLPMPPDSGPPLPRALGIRWPWSK